MAGILISHVHADRAHAERIAAALAGEVYTDVADVPSTVGAPGTAGRVSGLDAVVAVIGLTWLDEVRRDRDLVTELDAAMRHGLPLVPVLVDGAVMPRDDDLPAELRNLVARPAVAVGAGDGPERVAAELARQGVGRMPLRRIAASPSPPRSSQRILAFAVALLLLLAGLVFAIVAGSETGTVDTGGLADLLLGHVG